MGGFWNVPGAIDVVLRYSVFYRQMNGAGSWVPVDARTDPVVRGVSLLQQVYRVFTVNLANESPPLVLDASELRHMFGEAIEANGSPIIIRVNVYVNDI